MEKNDSRQAIVEEMKAVCTTLVNAVQSLSQAAAVPGPSTFRGESSASTEPGTSGASNEIKRLFRFNAGSNKSLRSFKRPIKVTEESSKKRNWSHMFVCLPEKTSEAPQPSEKAHLKVAGLGEKLVSFSANAGSIELNDRILIEFPKLEEAGGYELLRKNLKTRVLEAIPSPMGGFSVEFLRSIIGQAKIYIRPLQKNLNLTPADDPLMGIKRVHEEKCWNCEEYILAHQLKEHLQSCSASIPVSSSPQTPEVSQPVAVDVFEEDEITDANAMKESGLVSIPRTLGDIIEELTLNVSCSKYEFFLVRRSDILVDVLKKCSKECFDETAEISVEFVGELGVDTGGLRRELFFLLSGALIPSYVDHAGCFTHNLVALQSGVYCTIGKLAAMSVVHSGCGFRILSDSVFDYVCGIELKKIALNPRDVCDPNCSAFLKKLLATDDIQYLCMENFEILCESGFTKSPLSITTEDKPAIIHALTLHHTLLRGLAEMDDFVKGLRALGVLKQVREHPDIFREYFVIGKSPLTSDTIRRLFKTVTYSDLGSNERTKQEAAYVWFMDYMEEIEEGKNADVTLGNIVSFFTGSDHMPSSGCVSPVLSFNDENMYPTASTCGSRLTLPTKYTNYTDFKEKMTTGLLCHGGYGFM